MTDGFANSDGRLVVDRMIAAIHDNKILLSEIDGAIGDGDHGINMDKGFGMAEERITGESVSMSEALSVLGRTLQMEIGGSMGPLYGTLFKTMAKASKESEVIDSVVVESMLGSGLEKITDLGGARVGDKTMVDTLAPACAAAKKAREANLPLSETIDAVVSAAEAGWQSTKEMIARLGRSSRLGERSKGVHDAGATSCYLLIEAMGEAMKELVS